METVKSTGISLNAYEDLRNQLRGKNSLYEDSAWISNARYGTLDAYAAMISQLGSDTEKANKFKETYNYKFLSDKYKTLAMSNELYADRNNATTRTYLDNDGNEVTAQLSDYDYNKMLLQDNVKTNMEAFEREEFNKMLEQRSFLEKVGTKLYDVTVGATEGAVQGIINWMGGLYNIGEMFFAMGDRIAAGDFEGIDPAVRAAFKENEFQFIADDMYNWTYDFERSIGRYDYYGNKTGFSNFMDGLGESFGRMIPSIVISKIGGTAINAISKVGSSASYLSTPIDVASKVATLSSALAVTNRVLFYASMASNDITEALNDKELAKLPTYMIMGRAVIGATLEYSVEALLAKGFGKSVIDQMTYGLDSTDLSKYSFKGVTMRSEAFNIAKSALQEGLEEVLQDYSHWYTDNMAAFVAMCVGNTEYENIFKNASEFNIKTLVTSFMAGAIMSLAGSAIDIMTTPRIDTGKPLLDKDGNVIRDRKGNIKTEKFGKFKSYTIQEATQNIQDSAIAIMSDDRFTAEQKAKILESVVASTRTLYDLYNNVGETEFNNAMRMLNSMYDAYKSGKDFVVTPVGNIPLKAAEVGTAASLYNFSDKLRTMYSKIGTPMDKKTEQSVNEEAKTYHHGDPIGVINAKGDVDGDIGKGTDATLKTVLDETEADLFIVTKEGDGISITDDGKAVIGPKAHVENLTPEQLLSTIAETSVIRTLATDKRYTLVMDKIVEIYKKLPGNENRTDDKQLRREVAAQLITNQEFLFTAIQLGNRDTFAFINELYTNIGTIKVSKVLDIEYKNRIIKAVNDAKQVVIYYVSENPYIRDYADYTFLTTEDIETIRRNRWNLDLTKRLVQNNGIPTDDDVKVFTDKINAAPLEPELKQSMINQFVQGRASIVLQDLNQQFYYTYNSKYDNKVYMKPIGVGNVLMNTFLHNIGITIVQINKLYNGTDESSAKLYNEIRTSFENYTSDKFTFTIDGKTGECKVIEKDITIDKYTSSNLDTIQFDKALSAFERTSMKALANSGKDGKAALKILKGLVDFDKVPKTLKQALSVNDIITTPYFWSKELRSKAKTPNQVYEYLKRELVSESNGAIGISIDDNGRYVLFNLVNRMKTLNTESVGKTDVPKYADTLTDIIATIIAYAFNNDNGNIIRENFTEKTNKSNFRELFVKSATGFPITDIISSKYIPDELKSTKIRVIQKFGSSSIRGYYDFIENEIILNGAAYQEYILSQYKSSLENWVLRTSQYLMNTILHEYEHALQYLNNLSSGGQPIFSIITDEAIQSLIIKDVVRHMPEIAEDEDGKKLNRTRLKSAVSFLIYSGLDAEQAARGVSHTTDSFGSPFFYTLQDGHEEIYTPWGSKYDLTVPTNSTFVKQGTPSFNFPQSVKRPDIETKSKEPKSEETEVPAKSDKEIAAEKFKKSREEVKAAKAKAEQTKKVFISNTLKTNTVKNFYLKAYKGKYITANIYNMLTSIGEPKPYDQEFINAVNRGELRSTKAVTDYLLVNDVNDSTFNLLAKTVYNKNLTAEDAKFYLKNAASAYALRAVAKRLVADGVITKQEYNSLFFAKTSTMTTLQNVFKIVKTEDSKGNSAYARLLVNIKKRFNEMFDDESQRQMLAKLLNTNSGYDGTPDSVVKAALYTREQSFESNKDKRKTSIETEVGADKNKNADGEMTLNEVMKGASDVVEYDGKSVEDALSQIYGDETAEHAHELLLVNFAKHLNSLGYSQKDLADPETNEKLRSKSEYWVSEELARIMGMTPEKIEIEYGKITDEDRAVMNSLFSKETNIKDSDRTGLAQNTQQQVKRITEAIRLPSGYLSKRIYKLLCEKFPDLGFKPDADLSKKNPDIWSMPTKKTGAVHGSPLDKQDIKELNYKLREAFQWAKKIATGKLKISEERAKIQEMRDTLAEERAKRIKAEKERDTLKAEKAKWEAEGRNVHEYKADVDTVYIDSNRQMPDKFKLMLGTVFNKLRKTKGKFVNVNEMHTVKEYSVWIDDNAETLASLTSDEANDILDWILNSNSVSRYGSDEDIKYDAVTMWIYSYIYQNRAALGVDENLIAQVQDKFDHDKSKWGTMLALSRDAMKESNSTARVMASVANTYGIKFDAKDILELSDAIDDLKYTADKQHIDAQMQKIKEIRQRMYDKALAEYKGEKRNLLDKIVAYERLMMLSGPGTWIRNLTSNVILGSANKVTAKIGDKVWGGLNKIADKFDKIDRKRRAKTIEAPKYDSTIDNGVSIASKLLKEDVSTMDEDNLKGAIKDLDKLRNRARNEVNLGSQTKVNEAEYAVSVAKTALDKSIKEGKNSDVINRNRTNLKNAENMLKNARENLAKAPGHRREAIATAKENIAKLNDKIKSLEDKIAKKWTIDDEIKLNSYKASVELNEALIDMYTDPEAYLERVTTAYSAVNKLIDYKREMDTYNKKLDGNPLRKTLQGQYKIVGTKPTAETKQFVKEYMLESGLLDALKDGLSRYEVRKVSGDSGRLVDMIKQSVRNEIFAKNKFDIEIINKLSNTLFSTVLSDDKFIYKTFVYYVEAMLQESGVDLAYGITDDVLMIMKDAYTLAAYDYMHTTNIVYSMESLIKQKLGPVAYFAYQQIFPFAGASTNWYFECIRWSPVGLAIALKKFYKFDETVAKAQAKAEKLEGPSEKFSYYLLRRDIGKGLVGTGIFLIGMLLAVTGVIRVIEDETDKKLKLAIGKNSFVTIDLSEIQPTYSLLLGAIMGGGFEDADTFWKMFKSSLDYMAEDSVLGDVMDVFDGDSISNILEYRAQSMISMFIPNMLKTFTSSLYNHKVKYSKGLMGQLERIGVQAIPGLAYAMPKQYDPYTGEQQYKYYPNFWGWISAALSKLGPIKITARKVSEMEKIALSLGLHKKALSGKYEDIGQLSAKDVATLNEKYGTLNKADLKEFVSNRKRYRVKAVDKNGNDLNYYKILTYSQMTSEQRKSVINRIMANNAKIAKIYVWTSNGHKYYANESDYSELAKLGIYKNVLLENKHQSGFKE